MLLDQGSNINWANHRRRSSMLRRPEMFAAGGRETFNIMTLEASRQQQFHDGQKKKKERSLEGAAVSTHARNGRSTHSEASIACFSTRLASHRVFTKFDLMASRHHTPTTAEPSHTNKKKSLVLQHAHHPWPLCMLTTHAPRALARKLPREMGPEIAHSGNWRLTRVLPDYTRYLRRCE